MRLDTAGGDEVIEGVGKSKTDTIASQSIYAFPHSEDTGHVRGATVQFIERGVGSRSHVVCGCPEMTLVLNNLLVSRWLLFMADNVPGGRRKGGEHVRVDVVDGLYSG